MGQELPNDRPPPGKVTQVLQAAARDEPGAAEELLAFVYRELHDLARAQLRGERHNHTLQPTALVNEAWLRLCGQHNLAGATPAEFLRAAAVAMRRVLVDHARRRGRRKRDAGGPISPLDDYADALAARSGDLLALDEALAALAARDPRKARLVELRFFAGLGMAEAAQALDLPLRTAEREWTIARAFLRSRFEADQGD